MQVILCDEFILLVKAEMGGEVTGEHQELHKVPVCALKHRSNATTYTKIQGEWRRNCSSSTDLAPVIT